MSDDYNRGPGYLRGYNSMQLQAGITPQGPVAPLPMLSAPPHPAQTSAHLIGQTVTPAMRPRNYGPQHIGNPQFSTPTFGYNRQLAFNNAIGDTNSYIGMGAGAAGTAARIGGGLGAGAIGAGIGSALGPVGTFVGGLAGSMLFEGSGMGQGMHNMAASLFDPLVQRRAQASQMQALSQNFVRGGQNLSMTGQGLSMGASQQVTNNLRNMAQSNSFQSQTGGMFNTQDVTKISQLAGELGMLDQSQNVDQITRDVKRISTALGAFMKLAGEPDVQEAMKQMGQMRNLGMNFPQMTSAARNARQFARMAGTDVGTMVQAGIQGAQTFQAYGLSGGAGMQASMAGQGLAGLAATSMTARQLSMAGGQQGLASTLTNASAQTGTMDILLPALLTRRGGELGIDRGALTGLLNGNQNIQDVIQQGASNIRGLGGRRALMEMSTRRRELQSEMMESMSPEMQALLPMIIAQRTAQSVPGMTMGGALRTMGFGEQQARSMELMSQSPEFQENVIQQRRIAQLEMREDRARMRDDLKERARTPEFVRDIGRRARLGRRISGAWDRASEALAGYDDAEAEIEARGGTVQRVFERDRYRTSLQDARRRDLMRQDPSALFRGGPAEYLGQAVAGAQDFEGIVSERRAMTGPFAGLIGPRGFGFTQAGRGGEMMEETLMHAQGGVVETFHTLGLRPGGAQSGQMIRQRARGQARLARAFSRGQRGEPSQRRDSGTNAMRALRGALGTSADDDGRLRQMRASAATAIATYMEDSQVMGRSISPVNQTMLKGAIFGRLREQGYSNEEILAITQNDEVFQDVVSSSTDLMSDSARARVEEVIEGGAQLEAQMLGQGEEALREAKTTLQERFLEEIGVEVGFFDGIDDEQYKGLMDLLGGGDSPQSQVAGAMLMSRSGREEDKEAAARKLAELRETMDPEKFREAEAAARNQIDALGDHAKTFAESIGESGGIERALAGGGMLSEEVARIDTVRGLNQLVGGDSEAATRIGRAVASGNSSQVRDAINQFVDGNANISDEKKERLRRIAESGNVQQDLMTAIEQEMGAADQNVTGGEGGDADLEESENQGLLSVLGEITGLGGQGAGGGGDLGAAASELSEAAKDLREAAENFNAERTVNGLNDFARRNVP